MGSESTFPRRPNAGAARENWTLTPFCSLQDSRTDEALAPFGDGDALEHLCGHHATVRPDVAQLHVISPGREPHAPDEDAVWEGRPAPLVRFLRRDGERSCDRPRDGAGDRACVLVAKRLTHTDPHGLREGVYPSSTRGRIDA